MQRRIKVAVCGDTLLMAALRSSMESEPAIELTPVRVEALSGETLRELHPDAVIFDVACDLSFQQMLIDELPDLMLVSVELPTNCVQIWRGRQYRQLSTRELLEVIAGLRDAANRTGLDRPRDAASR